MKIILNFFLVINKINNEESGDNINIFEINYIYQNITDRDIMLNDNIFYEGSLISFIDNLKQNETLNNKCRKSSSPNNGWKIAVGIITGVICLVGAAITIICLRKMGQRGGGNLNNNSTVIKNIKFS